MNEPNCDVNKLRAGLWPIAAERLFVTWNLGPIRVGKVKPPKIAYLRGGQLLRGSYASAQVQEGLMTLDEAIGTANRLGHPGVGIAFFPGCGVVGLDVDSCIVGDQFTGTIEQQLAWDTFKSSSFTERSYSGEGVHAIALGNCETIKANGLLELFGDKNFLALTGSAGCGNASQVSSADIAGVTALIASLGVTKKISARGKDLTSELTRHPKSPEGNACVDDVRSALNYIDPNCDREMWLRIIWGIRHGLGDTEQARELADQWSKGEVYAK
jgi:hypothetical protein